MDFKKRFAKQLKKFKYSITIILILGGIILNIWASSNVGFIYHVLEHLGIFMASSFAVTLLYDIFIKKEERALFISDFTSIIQKEVAAMRSNELLDKGRRPLNVKVDFISAARVEVIELGEKLNAFSSYFTSQGESYFKEPISRLLAMVKNQG